MPFDLTTASCGGWTTTGARLSGALPRHRRAVRSVAAAATTVWCRCLAAPRCPASAGRRHRTGADAQQEERIAAAPASPPPWCRWTTMRWPKAPPGAWPRGRGAGAVRLPASQPRQGLKEADRAGARFAALQGASAAGGALAAWGPGHGRQRLVMNWAHSWCQPEQRRRDAGRRRPERRARLIRSWA